MTITETDIVSTHKIFAKDVQEEMILQRGTFTYLVTKIAKTNTSVIIDFDNGDFLVCSPYSSVEVF
jgi:hypothetical protein